VDWGLAKLIGQQSGSGRSVGSQIGAADEGALSPSADGNATPTRAGAVMGTPAYMSPEQAQGMLDRLGPPSDIYSLGATLYELLRGRVRAGGAGPGEVR